MSWPYVFHQAEPPQTDSWPDLGGLLDKKLSARYHTPTPDSLAVTPYKRHRFRVTTFSTSTPQLTVTQKLLDVDATFDLGEFIRNRDRWRRSEDRNNPLSPKSLEPPEETK